LAAVPAARVRENPWTPAGGRRKLLEIIMPLITVKLTDQELGLLTNLAADQLFRREFIDPKMPGYKFNPSELSLGKKLVERLRLMTDRAANSRTAKAG
jgi:hypothetical protein